MGRGARRKKKTTVITVSSTLTLFGIPHTTTPCPKCVKLLTPKRDEIRVETVLPLPEGAHAPMSRYSKEHICFDCAAAEFLMREGLDFDMMRIAVGNDRQEKLRLPGYAAGLPNVRASHPGDLQTLHEWQDHKFGTLEERDAVREDMKLESLEGT